MRPYVKVCGITREEDARAAVEAGVDALGFILAEESPRRIAGERASSIARALPPGVARVAVLVSPSEEVLAALAAQGAFTALQVHGTCPEGIDGRLPVPVVRALSTRPGMTLEDLAGFRNRPLLLDGFDPAHHGGTGKRADWSLARRAVEAGFRILLAGGLGPETLEDAVREVRPAAVDLNSGVEAEPGIKDPVRIREAIGLLSSYPPQERTSWPW